MMPRSTTPLALACALVLVATACAGGGGRAPTTRTPPPTAPEVVPEVTDIRGAGALEIHTSGFADWVTVAGGSTWLAAVGRGITRYDPRTGEVLDTIRTGDICLAMDEGLGSLWAVDCDARQLLRVDAATGQLMARIDLPVGRIPGESSVAVADDGVWMLSTGTAPPELVRVDASTNDVVDTVRAPRGATSVRAGDGSLWLTRAGAGQLLRVDPATGEELAEIAVAPGSTFLAFGYGGVWTLGSTGEVVHVDPATNAPVATIATGGAVSHGDIAVGGGYVWARLSESLLAQIDPATDTVVARYGPPSEGSGGIDADDDAVWVSDYLARTLWRLPLG
jgi:streptogramin lyase